MATLTSLDAKTIDELQELGKLLGSEKTIISNGTDTKKVSIDTIIGYAASRLTGISPSVINSSIYGGQCLVFIPEGQEVSVSERTPGCFYLEETKQTSIRTQLNIPSSVKVSINLGLRRL